MEKWWGPGLTSTLILSNNARPTLGISIQRNYSDAVDLPVINWLGPWTMNAFMSKLDDSRSVDDAKLLGLSLGFKPSSNLELNIRGTAQWGGLGRPESFSSLIDLISGANSCTISPCLDDPGNQLFSIDFNWNIPKFSMSVYGETTGEDQSLFSSPSRANLIGIKHNFNFKYISGLTYIEYADTSFDFGNQFNLLYNDNIYQTGYRYEGRSIGATWDNDSQVTTLGVIGTLKNDDQVEFKMTNGKINIDSINALSTNHSINSNGGEFFLLSAKWKRNFHWGNIELGSSYSDNIIDETGQQINKFTSTVAFSYLF